MVLVFFLLATSVVAQVCFLENESSYYCQEMDKTKAQSICEDECQIKETHCSTLPECQPVFCQDNCKITFKGVCAKEVPAGEEANCVAPIKQEVKEVKEDSSNSGLYFVIFLLALMGGIFWFFKKHHGNRTAQQPQGDSWASTIIPESEERLNWLKKQFGKKMKKKKRGQILFELGIPLDNKTHVSKLSRMIRAHENKKDKKKGKTFHNLEKMARDKYFGKK